MKTNHELTVCNSKIKLFSKLNKITVVLFLMIIFLWGYIATAQTNPAAQSLPYNQNFAGLTHASTTYPSGWQGWKVSGIPGSSFDNSSPTSDKPLIASSTAAITTGNIHNYNGKIGFLNNDTLDIALALSISTLGYADVKFTYDVMTIRNPYDGSSNTRINEVTLQYRIGTVGTFTNITGIEYQNNTTLQTTAVTTPQNIIMKSITLPTICNNESVVQLRWVSRQVSGSGLRPSFALDNIAVSGINCISPDAPLVSTPATICQNTTPIPLTANSLTDHNLVWYTLPTGGLPDYNAPVITTSTVGSSTHYVSQRTPVTVNIAIIARDYSSHLFSLVTLNILKAGTVIYFTDNGWTGTKFRGATLSDGDGTEGLCKLTLNRNIAPGTIIRSYNNTADYTWSNFGTIPGTSNFFSTLQLSPSGDQIYAFTNTNDSNPLFNIATMTHLFVFDYTNGFENATTNITGNIPPGLTIGINALTFNYLQQTVALNNDLQTRDVTQWISYIANELNYITGNTGILNSGTLNTNPDGCEGPRVAITANVISNEPTVITGNFPFCENGFATVDAGAGYSNYLWSNGATTQTINTNEIGAYTVTVTQTNSCTISSSAIISTRADFVNFTASAGGDYLCLGSNINLTANAFSSGNLLLNESFNGVTNNWTTINNSTGGFDSLAAWTLRPNGYSYGSPAFVFHSNDNSQFYLTNSDEQGTGGTTESILQSPVMSTIGYYSLSLDFYHYIELLDIETAKVEVSTDGNNWTTIETYQGNYVGLVDSFAHATINLNAYTGLPVFYVRFKYDAAYAWFWAIDNVTLSGAYLANTYSWTGPSSFTSTQQNPVIPNSVAANAGTYSVTATNSFGCSATATTSFSLLPIPKPVVIPHNDTTVCSSSLGFYIHVKDTGAFAAGYPPGTLFEWINYTPPTLGLDSIFAGLSDNYACIVYLPAANNGCSGISDTVFVDFGTAPSPLPFITQDSVKCYGGSTGSIVTNIISGYGSLMNYIWYDSLHTQIRNVVNANSSDTLKNVAAGKYYLQVYNNIGSGLLICAAEDSMVVLQPNLLVCSATGTDATCFGYANGTATVSASGGSGSFTYNWDTNPMQTNATATALSAGIYVITVSDIYNCTATCSYTVLQPDIIVSSATNSSPVCEGLDVPLSSNAVGGTGQLSYTWIGPDSYNSTNQNATLSDVHAVNSGYYIVTIIDENNCSATSSTNVTVLLNSSYTNTASICAGFVYMLPDGDTTSLAGNYISHIQNAAGCDSIITTILTIIAPPSATINYAGNPYCISNLTAIVSMTGDSGGTYSASPSGLIINPTTGEVDLLNSVAGSYTVTYLIDAGNGCPSVSAVTGITINSCNFNIVSSAGSNGSITPDGTTTLAGGSNQTYIIAANSCYHIADVLADGISVGAVSSYTFTNVTSNHTISAVFAANAAIVLSCNSTPVSCFNGFNGSASVVASGGSGGFSYLWNDGSITSNLSGLGSGNYSVTVTDNSGCTGNCQSIITQPLSALNITGEVQNVSCKTGNNGAVNITVTGGVASYSYLWNDGVTAEDRSNLIVGTYSVTVTDANSCTLTASFTITQPAAILSISLNKTNVRCGNTATGVATATPAGGTSPYSYHWNNGNVSSSINNVLAGIYTVTVTDANGCSATKSVTITQNPNLVVIANLVPSGATVSVAGGVPPYTYLWNTSPSQTTSTATGLAAATLYKVKVTDSKSCTKITQITTPNPRSAPDVSGELEILVYPNPSEGIVFLNFNSAAPFNYQLKVFDIAGRLILSFSDIKLSHTQTKSYDLSALPNGIYSINIQTDKGSKVFRVAIQKRTN